MGPPARPRRPQIVPPGRPSLDVPPALAVAPDRPSSRCYPPQKARRGGNRTREVERSPGPLDLNGTLRTRPAPGPSPWKAWAQSPFRRTANGPSTTQPLDRTLHADRRVPGIALGNSGHRNVPTAARPRPSVADWRVDARLAAGPAPVPEDSGEPFPKTLQIFRRTQWQRKHNLYGTKA